MSQRPLTPNDLNALLRTVNSNALLNRQLQGICGAHGLSRGGVKAELRSRVTNLIQNAYNASDVTQFYALKRQIDEAAGGSTTASSRPTPPPPPHAPHPNPHPAPAALQNFRPPAGIPTFTPYQAPTFGNRPAVPGPSHYPGSSGLQFKPSPFYVIKSIIGGVKECTVVTMHRNSVNVVLRVGEFPELSRCLNDKTYRVMVFCAADTMGRQDISFPHQSELKVNGGDVKANLRGLKKKPGSTRPVDITDHLRLRQASYANNIEFTYALTTKKYYLALYLCQVVKSEDLVARIRNGPKIAKVTVLREMANKAKDAEIETTSQVMSLKCPLSYMRLTLPCRGIACAHNQCFDALSYLQLQEQGPQWVCPICNKPVPFEQLAVDEYVSDILSKTPKDLEQVTIEPSGEWKLPGTPQSAPRKSTASFDLIEDLDSSPPPNDSPVKLPSATPSSISLPSLPSLPRTSIGTASVAGGGSSSREGTSVPRPGGGISTKRPAPAVIDLTLSSDEEDNGPPPAKRRQVPYNGFMGGQANGFY